MVGIVACNWDGNTIVNAKDKSTYLAAAGTREGAEGYDVGVDLDRNGTINTKDKAIYLAFAGLKTTDITYADVTVK